MNQFVDTVSFEIEAGHGGAGSVSFRREPYVPMGGPDGGNGGDGGNIVILVDARVTSFGKIKSRKKFKAKDGDTGSSRLSDGKGGEDFVIKVPIGTLIYNEDYESTIADLTEDGDSIIIAYGGKGGKGNKFYATSTNQAPDYAQHGLGGEKLNIRLEVKLIADIGLVGLPNAGKSSLLARVTRARPKIASYPFTTLQPNLGVCYLDIDRHIIIADIPGIIEGAHKGAGLGHTFLRHIERTGALAIIIDITDDDIYSAYKDLRSELKLYSEELSKKKFVIILNKTDMLETEEVEEIYNNFSKKIKKDYGGDILIFSMSVFASSDKDINNIAETFYTLAKKESAEDETNKKPLGTIKKTKTSKTVFGPIKSKRLGKSLGIDVTPYKTCSYDCVYCQLGADENTTTELKNFYSVGDIIYELKEAIHKHKNIDYITISGSGEPTLYSNLKELISEIKNTTDIPVALITNGSMLHKQSVRSSLLLLDLILPSLDAGNYDTFQAINRPSSDTNFDDMIKGLFEFKRVFKGEIWLEVFIIKGFNDSDFEIKDIASIANKLNPNKVQLVTSTRRVACEGVGSVTNEELESFRKYFTGNVEIPSADYGYTQNENKNIKESDVLEALIRHPDTVEVIASGLESSVSVVSCFLEKLLLDEKIYAETVHNKTIYAVNLK